MAFYRNIYHKVIFGNVVCQRHHETRDEKRSFEMLLQIRHRANEDECTHNTGWDTNSAVSLREAERSAS